MTSRATLAKYNEIDFNEIKDEMENTFSRFSFQLREIHQKFHPAR